MFGGVGAVATDGKSVRGQMRRLTKMPAIPAASREIIIIVVCLCQIKKKKRSYTRNVRSEEKPRGLE